MGQQENAKKATRYVGSPEHVTFYSFRSTQLLSNSMAGWWIFVTPSYLHFDEQFGQKMAIFPMLNNTLPKFNSSPLNSLPSQ